MLFALNNASNKIEAEPGLFGRCPDCKGELRPKCGEVNIWHWAHISADCVTKHEPETEWHLNWKRSFHKDWVEVKIGDHRADIQLPCGTVIELQNSPLSTTEARERENHYGQMIWVINGTELGERFKIKDKKSHLTYTWLHRRRWVDELTKPVYVDLGKGDLFKIEKSHGKSGWGSLIKHSDLYGLIVRANWNSVFNETPYCTR